MSSLGSMGKGHTLATTCVQWHMCSTAGRVPSQAGWVALRPRHAWVPSGCLAGKGATCQRLILRQ